MLFPSIDVLLTKVDSKYSLVVAASKRARELKSGDSLLINRPNSYKYVGIALEEIDKEKIIIDNRQ